MTNCKTLSTRKKRPFQIFDDTVSDTWNDYIMQEDRVTIYDDKLVFKICGKVISLKGDVLKKITDYQFNTTDSPDAKLIIDIMEEMHFDIHSRSKKLGDRNVIKKLF